MHGALMPPSCFRRRRNLAEEQNARFVTARRVFGLVIIGLKWIMGNNGPISPQVNILIQYFIIFLSEAEIL
jgi:hypothetical protein